MWSAVVGVGNQAGGHNSPFLGMYGFHHAAVLVMFYHTAVLVMFYHAAVLVMFYHAAVLAMFHHAAVLAMLHHAAVLAMCTRSTCCMCVWDNVKTTPQGKGKFVRCGK